MNRVPSIFADPWVLSLLFAMPLLTITQALSAWRSRRLLARFAQPISLIGLLPAPPRQRWLTALLFGTGMTALVAGAAGPRWGLDADPQIVAGRDLFLVIDMSNSMRATDAPPDRFQRAVEGVRDLIAYVRTRGGHRLGLMAFAGDAQIVCPLTHDYDHVRSRLDALNMDQPPLSLLARPGLRSGTRIGQAMRLAVAAQDPDYKGFQDVMLISDGHDPLGNEDWEAGLRAVAAAGVPFFTVGIGDPQTGAELSLPGRPERVRTRLHEYPLQEIAKRTGGFYLGARTEPPRLGEFFRQRIEGKGATLPTGDALPLARPRQAWFYGAALAMFGLMTLLQLRRSDLHRLVRRVKSVRELVVRPSLRRMAAAGFVLATLSAASPLAPDEWERRGQAAFEDGRFDEAVGHYARACERSPEPGRIAHNAGVACFNLGRYREAERWFRAALESGERSRQARVLYNLGTCLLHASTGRDAPRLAEAVDVLQRSAEAAPANDPLHRAARHNLELAKQLWRKLGNEPPPPERDPILPDEGSSAGPNEPPEGPDDGREPGASGNRRAPQAGPAPGKAPGPAPIQTDQNPGPGRGSMSPLSDREQLAPLPVQEAREQLRLAGERIARQRRALLRPANGPGDYPDW